MIFLVTISEKLRSPWLKLIFSRIYSLRDLPMPAFILIVWFTELKAIQGQDESWMQTWDIHFSLQLIIYEIILALIISYYTNFNIFSFPKIVSWVSINFIAQCF